MPTRDRRNHQGSRSRLNKIFVNTDNGSMSDSEETNCDFQNKLNISRMKSANLPLIQVNPDTGIKEAITLMLVNDFSQLPVMTSETTLKGLFSWKSLGRRLALGLECSAVRECMDPCHEVRNDTSIFDAIDDIVKHDSILVRDVNNNKICGIVTTSDLSSQFRQLTEPFLLLAEIENHIRDMIGEVFSSDDLKAIGDPEDSRREIKDASDLSIGEYVVLLQNSKNWDRLNIKIDRSVFTKKLDEIRRIRNNFMHFDAGGITEDNLETLRKFHQFLQRLAKIRATA